MPRPRLDIADGLATLTLEDPEGVNALDADHIGRLRRLVAQADADPSVAVVLLRAEARAFCAGGDIAWFAEQGDAVHDGIMGLADDAAEVVRLLHESAKITIAAVHGAVAGAGLGLVLACDLVVAADDSVFSMAYARIGASPDLGVTAFLARDVGYRRALELCLLAEVLTADEALALGLVNRVVPRDALDETAGALAARIGAGPRQANATAKRLLRTAARRPLPDHLYEELRSVADLSRGADWREGIAAFLEHRKPQFGS